MSDNVKSIGYEAFCNCFQLKKIKLSSNLEAISSRLLASCYNLEGITIPNSVKSIGNNAFYGCTCLTELIIPDSVTLIGMWAFYGCKCLAEITIPQSVSTIESDAFVGCTHLKIKGYDGSYAQKYATKNSIPFQVIDDTLVETTTVTELTTCPAETTGKTTETTVVTEFTPSGIFGDVDGDGAITAYDAQLALIGFTEDFLGFEPEERTLTPEQEIIADVDLDGELTAYDATVILTYFSLKYNAGFDDLTWEDLLAELLGSPA